jgi:hypothetical protein
MLVWLAANWLNIVSLLGLPLLYFMWKVIGEIRHNEIRHLQVDIERLTTAVALLTQRLDTHILWHLDQVRSAGKTD